MYRRPSDRDGHPPPSKVDRIKSRTVFDRRSSRPIKKLRATAHFLSLDGTVDHSLCFVFYFLFCVTFIPIFIFVSIVKHPDEGLEQHLFPVQECCLDRHLTAEAMRRNVYEKKQVRKGGGRDSSIGAKSGLLRAVTSTPRDVHGSFPPFKGAWKSARYCSRELVATQAL